MTSPDIRLAELLGSLSFAGDLGRGQPMGHVLRTARIAMALANKMRVPSMNLNVYYTALLLHAGCTAGSAEFAAFLSADELLAQKDFCLCDPNNMRELFGWLRRNTARGQPLAARTLRMLQLLARGEKGFEEIDRGCSEVGSRIAARLGMSQETQLSLYHVCESWNGKGPHGLRGEDVPLAGRIANVAMILEVFLSERGTAAAIEAATVRSGKSFDPSIAAAAAELLTDDKFLNDTRSREAWESVLELEPPPTRTVGDAALDDFAHALADIIDLKSPWAVAHSRRTAEVAEAIARRLGLASEEVTMVRRAALVHDAGMVAVPSFLLEEGAAWSEADQERFRLHTYYTERILARSPHLHSIGVVGAAHHERIDGSGFHRGASGNELSIAMRVVGAASAFVEASEQAGAEGDAEKSLELIGRHSLDGACLTALREEIGSSPLKPRPRRFAWPAGLTEREVEVMRLIGGGLTVRSAAERLVISEHTARHHVESIYSKLGVSSRAAMTLFALENGVLLPLRT